MNDDCTTETKTDKEKADVLVKHFSDVFTDEPAEEIPRIPKKQCQLLSFHSQKR